jgi:hypothetical protein
MTERGTGAAESAVPVPRTGIDMDGQPLDQPMDGALMDSGCPDCWGYNDAHPCLCHARSDENAFADNAHSPPARIEHHEPSTSACRPGLATYRISADSP